MRLLLTMAFMAALFSIPLLTWGQEAQGPVALQSKMDGDLKSIIEVLVNSVVKRFPALGERTAVSVNENSALNQGLIQGTFDVEAGSAESPLSSQGQVDIQLTSAGAGKIDIGITTSGQISTSQLITALAGANQSICVGVSTDECSVVPLLTGADSGLTPGQQGTLAFSRFKENLTAYLESYAEQASGGKRRQSFGAAAAQDDDSGKLTAESATQLRDIIATSLSIQPQDDGAIVSIDMDQVRGQSADLAAINPGISFLVSFKNIQIVMNGAVSAYTMTSVNEVPERAILTYDSYIQQEQAKPQGLKSLNELVSGIGLWLVETCSSADKQAECLDKMMNTCARDAGHVAACVDQVRKLKAGRDAHHNGDEWNAGLNTAGSIIDGQLQKAGDGVSDFFSFGWLFGNPQP